MAAQKEKELPFKLPTRRKSVIEEETNVPGPSFPEPRLPFSESRPSSSRERAYEMPVQTERGQASNTRLAQTMDIMGLGGGF